MEVTDVPQPHRGMWRVGRSPDPVHFGEPLPADQLDNPHTGNRFDSPTADYRVCYFATTLDGCFGETLARFRPDPELVEAATEEGFMAVGEVPAAWRQRRLAVRVRAEPSPRLPSVRFLDVEGLSTRQVLRGELAPLLAYYGYRDLDVPTVRGADRRITRWIGKWAHDQRDDTGLPVFAGVRYLSRLSSDWECWAVFDDVPLRELARQPILQDERTLRRVARAYELRVF